jgi:alanine transaminase
MSSFTPQPRLSASTLNAHLVEMQYSVRGRVLEVATALKAQLLADPSSLPFDEVVSCNIGNPQALGQRPPPFNRQVLSLMVNPELISTAPGAFLPQALARAKAYLESVKVGAYSGSQGVECVRVEVAAFIARRDGCPADKDSVFLTNGASDGVKALMQACIRGGDQRDGVLVPIPQYPLYSAVTTLYDGELLGYHLDEAADWSMTTGELARAADEASARGVNVRGLVVINPGNPTSQQLTRASMEQVVTFCEARGLVLMADEVYQDNLYGTAAGTFVSFKKVVVEMASQVQLVSFHSVSKGFTGECGTRGGYFELHNIAPDVKQQLYKLASISLCSNLLGQLAVGLMVNPPTEGEALAMHVAHKETILASLEWRQKQLVATLNTMAGVSCTDLKASLYAFPQIALPAAAVAEARKEGIEPDLFYCLALLQRTGIVTVPGSGFKQKEGTFHFRITILPPKEQFADIMGKLKSFHAGFMEEYGGASSL